LGETPRRFNPGRRTIVFVSILLWFLIQAPPPTCHPPDGRVNRVGAAAFLERTRKTLAIDPASDYEATRGGSAAAPPERLRRRKARSSGAH
jgi:hypothetical protein